MEEEGKKEQPQPVTKEIAVDQKEGPSIGFRPANFEELWRFASMISKTNMVPKEFQGDAGKILAAVQMGHEVGLPPMQALQTIAVINGRPTIWGDGAAAVVRDHPACEYLIEIPPDEALAKGYGECTVKRKDQAQPITRRFTLQMAEEAGLIKRGGPDSPWTRYRGRMLQMRARAWAMRDAIPEALKGLGVREEVSDMEPVPEPVAAPKRLSEGSSVHTEGEPEPTVATADHTQAGKDLFSGKPEPGKEG